jgi:GT2 family glycosyltransferase
MNGATAVSVVVVSRGRPAGLRHCLIGLSQQRYALFEVVIVTDSAGRLMLRGMPQAAHAKIVPFEEANISAARNLGIAHSDGEVVAFIDDDAVPEPSWLMNLSAPFSLPEVTAVAGFVRGRNGISWQWRAETVDRTGLSKPLKVDPVRPTLLNASREQAVKTQGTNMAIRRATLIEIGGFDPNFRFYLDETDLNLRLAARRACTAVVPRAQVHHGFAASERRRADRVPRDLYEIGASWAVFLRKHCDPDRQKAVRRRIFANERRRLVRHMVRGLLEPRDVGRLMRGLRQGFEDGGARRASTLQPIGDEGGGFVSYPVSPTAESEVIAGFAWHRRGMRRMAERQVGAGRIVTLIRLTPNARYHHVQFREPGYWEQTGGLFGRSERHQRLFSFWTLRGRVRAETRRVAMVRLIT